MILHMLPTQGLKMNHFTYLSFAFVQTHFLLKTYSQKALAYEKAESESRMFSNFKVYHYLFP